MARVWYGSTPADFTMSPSGRVVAGVELTVWTARTGGTQVTDLLDANEAACTAVTSDASGGVRFQAPDGTDSTLWIDSGVGSRLAVRPVNLPTAGLSVGTVTTGTADATLTPDGDDAWTLDLVLPSAGANGVNTAAIQDNAVTADKIAADAVGTSEIAANAVGPSELADNAVDTAAIANGAVTAAKFAVQPGNLLTANQASGTDTLGDATGLQSWNACNLSSSTTVAAQGVRSLFVEVTGGAPAVGTSGTVPVTAGEVHTAVASVYAQESGRTVGVSVLWFTAASAFISASSSIGKALVTGTGWYNLSGTVVAPSNAAYAALVVEGLLQDFYIDKLGLWKGAGGTWAMPGTPIVGQSPIAVNNAVDLSGTGTPEGVITAAPGSTWLQTDSTTDVKGWIRWIKATGTGNTGWVAGPEADTGWRDVSASLENSWAGANSLSIRRIGKTVFILIEGISAASATSGVPYTLPAGFRPAGTIRHIVYKTDMTLRRVGTSALGTITITSYAAGDTLYGTASGATDAAWPSSLPGSVA